MTRPANHACFEAAAGDIIRRAYEAFPAPIQIDAEADHAALLKSGGLPDHCPVAFDPYHYLFISTAAFLEREGLLHIHEKSMTTAEGVTLTSKGFLMLNRPSDLVRTSGTPTIGQMISDAAKDLGKATARATVSRGIGLLLETIAG